MLALRVHGDEPRHEKCTVSHQPANPAYTSQTCNRCGCVDAGNRTAQAIFACLSCGHAENADMNAAKNILAAGHAVWAERSVACGAAVSRAKPARVKRAAAMKQEPTEGLAHGESAHQPGRNPQPSGRRGCQGGENCTQFVKDRAYMSADEIRAQSS